jgi:hypothetical protein
MAPQPTPATRRLRLRSAFAGSWPAKPPPRAGLEFAWNQGMLHWPWW